MKLAATVAASVSLAATATLGLAAKAHAGICESCWERVAGCESSHIWNLNTGNGFYGGLQFMLSTWRAVGGRGYPHQASRWTQITMAERLRQTMGLGPWPVCGSKYYG